MDNASIDYITICVHSYDNAYDTITHLLGTDTQDFYNANGRYGYGKALRHGNISIYYDGRPKMGICIELSGQGCREYAIQRGDEYAVAKLLLSLTADDAVTRIDIAFDDLTSRALDFGIIRDKINKGEIRTKLRSRSEIIVDDGLSGHTLYFGSRKSDYFVRIYDKAAEQNAFGIHWVRVEQVFRHEDAKLLVESFMQQSIKIPAQKDTQSALFTLAAGILMQKLTFVDRRETNISRSHACGWWTVFLKNAPPLRLSKDAVAPSIDNACRWIDRAVMPTLATLVLILGTDWLHNVLSRGIKRCGSSSRYTVLNDAWTAIGKEPAFTWSEDVYTYIIETFKGGKT